MSQVQFRIVVGSYEHTLLCLSVTIPVKKDEKDVREAHFQPIFHFQAHNMSIRALDVCRRYLVSGANDEHICLYDMQKRKELGTLLKQQGSITKLVFSDESNRLKDDNSEYLSHKMGKWLLSASEDGTILLWRVKDWEQFGTLKGHKAAINDISIHPSGRVAISVSNDRTVKLWNLMTAHKASTLKLRGKITLGQLPYFCKFDKKTGGDYFVVGLSTRLLLYKTREAKVFHIFTFKKTLMCIDFLVIDLHQYLVVGLSDGSIGFYPFDPESLSALESEDDEDSLVSNIGEPEFKLQGHATRVKGFSIYQEKDIESGKVLTYLVSISSDGKIVIWDMQKRDQVAVYATSERLNVVCTLPEYIEKADTMQSTLEKAEAVSNDMKDKTDEESEEEKKELDELVKKRKRKARKQRRREKRRLMKIQIEK